MAHKFNPEHMDRLFNPERRQYNDPEKILGYLDLGEGKALLDVGSGPGWFALPAAEQVGDEGTVYALDVSQRMLDALQDAASELDVENIRPVLVREGERWDLSDGSCDAALLANVFHEVEKRVDFLAELRRVLRAGAGVLIVDWKPGEEIKGPPQEERLEPSLVTETFERAGFVSEGGREIGPYHYGLRFTWKGIE